IRCEGIRLFLLWLQALQTNCTEEQILIFACLVPGFPPVMSSRGPCTLDNVISPPNSPDAKIFPEEITPLLPAVSGEKIAEDQTCYFLQLLLKYMVIQVRRMYVFNYSYWEDCVLMSFLSLTCLISFKTVGVVNQDKNPELETSVSYASEQERSHSNSSTLSDRRLSNSSLCSIEEQHRTVYEMVQRILLSTRGYVNFVNEVFRQVNVLGQLPLCSF
ncbi:hypothetical protein CIB84_004431, partial [Bambusicola thoracicus]